ncbi:ParB/RepB/Spo0J family partition protein [Amaricoccus tamworthensis]|uniref:ParB/RepB/Spo0J family partition protein n=1 Tax=Amaricoccus tamworthensis TaxID=57002 RepID=UPI003C7C695A
MARRKRVEGPSAEELRELEAGFAAKPSGNPFAVPPIAQVARDAASAVDPETTERRMETARNEADAKKYREAERGGLLLQEIPIASIAANDLTRDRMDVDREELEELKASIASSGLRMPIEVFKISDDEAGQRYGLISGLRRLTAVREINGPSASIRAIIRSPRDVQEKLVSMVEENEIRSDLSHYERGRIAALAVAQGTFPNIDQAVAGLFHAASKAKRSKVRSFALIHEELGDMLNHATVLTEKDGLRLANALRLGFDAKLRSELALGQGTDPASEWALLEPVIREAEGSGRKAGRGGRPKTQTPDLNGLEPVSLPNGITLTPASDRKGYLLRLSGDNVDRDAVSTVLAVLRDNLHN